jgi:hypothetical protein
LSGEWKRQQKEEHAMKVEGSVPIPKMRLFHEMSSVNISRILAASSLLCKSLRKLEVCGSVECVRGPTISASPPFAAFASKCLCAISHQISLIHISLEINRTKKKR